MYEHAPCYNPFVFRLNEEIDKDAVIKRLQATLAKLYLELATYKVHKHYFMIVVKHYFDPYSVYIA